MTFVVILTKFHIHKKYESNEIAFALSQAPHLHMSMIVFTVSFKTPLCEAGSWALSNAPLTM